MSHVDRVPTASRRQLFKFGLGAGLLAATGFGVSSCGSSGSSGSGGSPSPGASDLQLPNYIPFEGVKPDLAPTAEGVQAGYFSLPEKLVQSAKSNPGGGIELSWMGLGNSGMPVLPLDQNEYWQELNKRLDASLNFDLAPGGDAYATKLATALAGDSLGDLVTIKPVPPPQLPDVLEAKFQDLTEFLAGDAIEDYPNLANIPTAAWQSCVSNGRLFAVPSASPFVGPSLYALSGIRDEDVELPEELTDGADVLALCEAMTDPAKQQWAFQSPQWPILMYARMLGAPNVWAIDDGAFTHRYETEEYKDAINLGKQLWDKGLIYPDAFADTTSQYRLIPTGKIGLVYQQAQQPIAAMKDFRQSVPEMGFTLFELPKYDGGGRAPQHLIDAVLATTALKKAEPDRIRTILSILDWIAAPFGSEEEHFVSYGIDGVHSQEVNGVLTLTEAGTQQKAPLLVPRLARPMPNLSGPGVTPDDQRKVWEHQKSVLADPVPYPLAGLYSQTDGSQGLVIERDIQAVIDDIILDRKSLSDWDAAVDQWRASGGDTIRAEYEQAYEQANA